MRKLKLFFACMLLTLLSIGQVWAETATYTVSTASEVTETGDIPDGSSAALTGNAGLNGGMLQLTYGKNAVLTISGYEGCTITGFKMSMKSNSSKGKGSMTLVAGETTLHSVPDAAFNSSDWYGSWSTSAVDVDFTSVMTTDYTVDEDENIVITVTNHGTSNSTNSLYIGSYTITYTTGGSGDPTDCSAPVFEPNGGAVASGTEVTITTETEGATIYYTMGADPADPTSSSDEYTDPIEITANTTIKAIAIKNGLNDSEVSSATFTVAAALSDDEFAWSASSYEATLGGENSFPTLTNTHNLSVTYQSTTEATATVNASGEVTPVKVGTTTIKAIFAGNDDYAAKTVTYELTVAKAADSNTSKTLDLSTDETDTKTDSKLEWEGTYVTVTAAKATASTATNNYCPPSNSSTRFYKNSTLTFTPVEGYKIKSIVFTATTVAYATALQGSTWTNATASVPTTGTDAEKMVVTVTASGAGAVSATIGGTCGFTQIVINYGIVAPEVTVDPSSLSFDAKQNIAVDGKTFTLTGANLTSGLTLAASAGFNVSPESITAADAMAQGGVEVTVTPATPTAATTPVDGTVTISGGGLASNVVVNLSMAVTPTYAVVLAVNDNTMGSATINGGAGPVYAEYADEVTLVATANPGYEFVNWTVSTDEIDFGEDAEKANGAVATIGAAGTITATFQAQACTNLDAPTLDEVTKTYQSATIAWNAVDNADGYVLNIVKHSDASAVLTDEIIAAPEVSFEKTGLDANTQYDYTVMAVGDGTSYCDESNPLLEGNFTTNDYPSVIVTYSENGNTDNQVSKKIQTAFALPTEVTNNISGKTFVGWTTKSDFEDGDESDEETYFAKGADFTITSNAAVTLYAVYATAGSGDVTISSTPLTSAPEQGAKYVIGANHKTAGIKYFSTYSGTGSNLSWGTMDASTTIYFTLSGTTSALTAYDGSAYLKNRSGGFEMSTTSTTIALQADGAIRGSSEETATRLRYNSEQDTYGLRWYASDKSTGNPAYFYKVEQNTSYSDYVISGSAALPVLDAPTFPVAEGVFYESTDITISAATGASIYYTTDGTTPSSTNGTLYEGAITLNAYGTYYFKAIAVQAGHEDSEVAEATYYFGMTFASVSDLYTYLETNSLTSLNNVKVTGLVSRIATAWDAQKGYLTYYISDNGQTTNDLQMYRGAGTGADVLAVGDQVTVTGNYTLFQSTTHEFGAGNTIVARTAGAHDSYEIAGNLGKTNFAAGEKWLDSYLSGLSVNDVYNTGYKAAVSDVSFSADKTDQTALESTDTQITVTATKDQAELATKDFAITVSSATLVSIALKDGYKTEYYVGDELVKPTVIATLSDNSQIEEVATACTGQNMSVAGVYTVNVAFTYGDNTIDEGVEYQITVKAIYNNDDAPHTVAEALDIIGQHHNTSTASSDSIVVAGIVSRLDGSYVNTYWISDDGQTNNELEVYRGTYLGKVSFTTNNQLQVGDEVVVKGKVKTYSNTKEFDTGSRLVSLARTPNFEVADVAEALEINISEDLGVEDLTITKEGEGAVTLVSSDETKVSIVNGKLHAVAAAENVEITANLAANGIYKANSDVFHVSVIAERTRYDITFDPDGGTGTDPVIADQLAGATVELPENPYSKANSAFAGWVVNDGAVEITEGHFTMPAEAVTIKATWNPVATCAISFKVNGIEVATANASQTAEFSLAGVSHPTVPGFTWEGWSEIEYADEVETEPTTITSYTPAAQENTKTLYGIYSRLDDSGANYGKYEKATAVAEGDYLIVCENQNVAMDGSLSTLDAAGNNKAVTISDGVLTLENADNYVFTIAAVTDGYSIKSKSGYYVGGKGSDSNGMNSSTSTEYVNTITISGGDADIVGNGAYMRCNPNSNNQWFRYFKSSTYTSQKAIQLYKKNTGTTYYTSSPVEKVTITFKTNGGEGGCTKAIINKGSEFTICENVPTKTYSVFAGWKLNETTTIYQANQNIGEVEEDITLTAQWNEASKYTVTYNTTDGATGTTPTETDKYEGESFSVAAQGNLVKVVDEVTYEFQGWKYNGKLYEAGASFTMPAVNVTLVAQWKKSTITIPTDKMSMITSESALADGMQVALGCSYVKNETSYFAMAGDITGTNKYMTSVTENVSLSDGIATYPGTVVVLTLEQVEGGWMITKDGTYYLTLTGSDIKWDTQANATVWTINFENNNVKIATSTYWIQYNSSDTRFKTYGSTSNMKAIQLFGKAVVVTQTTNVSDLGYVEGAPIVASGNITLTIDEPTTAPSITAQNGATIVVEETTSATSLKVDEESKIEVTAPTTVNEVFSVAATMGGGKSGQLGGVANVTLAQNVEAYFDITLGDNANSAHWHAIAVPFPVDVINGVYDAETGEKLTNEVNYAIMDYHGEIRAQGLYGWKKIRTTLMPGVFYLMTVDGNTKTFRFKMAGTILPTGNDLKLSLHEYAVSTGIDGTNGGWNGVANPTLEHGQVGARVQVLNPATYTFEPFSPNSCNFVVGTPFFYQARSDSSMTMVAASGDVYYAPKRANAMNYEDILIRFGNNKYKDRFYISAREDALSTYEIGRDLLKMTMTNTPSVPQIFGKAYGHKLCIVDAPLANNQAIYDLDLYAPAAGTYSISAQQVEGATLYVTYNGAIVWNLSLGDYELDLTRGTTTGYGLLLVAQPNQMPTGLDSTEGVSGDAVQKILLNGQLYILRDGHLFDAVGHEMK